MSEEIIVPNKIETIVKAKPKIDMAFLEKRPLSYSSLKMFAKSPLHYYHYITTGKKASTDALTFGNLFDCMLLTPHLTEQNFAVYPIFDARTKEGKKIRDEFELASQGKMCVTAEQYSQAVDMKAAVLANEPFAERLMMGDKRQVELRWRDIQLDDDKNPIYDFPMLGKIDIDGLENHNFIADLKSTIDAEPEGFPNACYNFDYHIQAAMYINGYKAKGLYPDYFILAVDKTEPYGCSVFKATKKFIEIGQKQLQNLLIEFKYCMDNDLWHQSYNFKAPIGYHQLDLPYWAVKRIEG